MATQTVHPFAQSYPTSTDLNPTAVITPPVLVAGGSIDDDSDSSYVNLGAYEPVGGEDHIEILATDFQMSPSTGPQAFLVYFRARTPGDTVPANFNLDFGFIDLADGSLIESDFAIDPDPLFHQAQSEPAWFARYDNSVPNLDDPTGFGGWRFIGDDPAFISALTGAGLRLTMHVETDTGTESRASLLDIFEVRLLVDTRPSGKFPLRRYPPVNNSGSGPTRHYPRAVNRRAGGTY